MECVENDNTYFRQKNEELKNKLEKLKLTQCFFIKNNDEKVQLYIGLPIWKTLFGLCS